MVSFIYNASPRFLKLLVVFQFIFSFGLTDTSRAQGTRAASEFEIKAAFILNFAKFAEWPAPKGGTNTPMILGILGEDPFEGALDKVAKGKTISGRQIQVIRYRNTNEARGAHLLFIATNDRRRATHAASTLAGSGVLTVGQTEDFAENGGMIGFKTVDDRVRFEINPKAAEKEGIKISSKLLSLATKVWK